MFIALRGTSLAVLALAPSVSLHFYGYAKLDQPAWGVCVCGFGNLILNFRSQVDILNRNEYEIRIGI